MAKPRMLRQTWEDLQTHGCLVGADLESIQAVLLTHRAQPGLFDRKGLFLVLAAPWFGPGTTRLPAVTGHVLYRLAELAEEARPLPPVRWVIGRRPGKAAPPQSVPTRRIGLPEFLDAWCCGWEEAYVDKKGHSTIPAVRGVPPVLPWL